MDYFETFSNSIYGKKLGEEKLIIWVKAIAIAKFEAYLGLIKNSNT